MTTELPKLPPPDGTLVPPAMGVHGSEQYAHGWGSASLRAYAAAAVAAERAKLPNLAPVIAWLENGCDPKEAAKELRFYARKMGQDQKGQA